MCGSPRYMAPELFDAKSKLTEKIDIWAMGCMFVEIFGGPFPYEGCNSLVELTRTILDEKKTPVVPAHIHPLIQPLLRKCLWYYHEQRLSAKEVYKELKNVKRNLRSKNALAD
jgi:serine/threonine protein kinase